MISSISLAGSCTFRFVRDKAVECLNSEPTRTALRVAAVGALLYAGKRVIDTLRSPTPPSTLTPPPQAPAPVPTSLAIAAPVTAAPAPKAVAAAPPPKPKAAVPTPREVPNPDPNCIIPKDPDGNCWLNCCIEGLARLKSLGRLEKPIGDVLTLRKEVVREMRARYNAHDEQFREYLGRAMEADKANRLPQLEAEKASLTALLSFGLSPEENKIATTDLNKLNLVETALNNYTPELYFDTMERDCQFGGIAEFYTISQLYEVNIVVWRDLGSRITPEYDIPLLHDQSRGVIYVVLAPEGNHFNYLDLSQDQAIFQALGRD